MAEIQRITFLNCPIDSATMEQAVDRCLGWCRSGRSHTLITVNAALAVNMRRNAALRRAIEAGDLIVPDGVPVVWASWLLGTPLASRVAGVDLMARLLTVASEQHLRVYFLGATEEVLQKLLTVCREQYPGIDLAGHRNGYFAASDDSKVVKDIRHSQAAILFVGMPSPFKEVWCEKHRDALRVPVIMGVGGSFDVLAGHIRRAPGWMQRCGLEWLWRLMMEPRKLWKRYLVTNTVFIWLVLRQRLGLLRSDAPAAPAVAVAAPAPLQWPPQTPVGASASSSSSTISSSSPAPAAPAAPRPAVLPVVPGPMKSYASGNRSLRDRWREFRHLYRYHRTDVPQRMRHFVLRMGDIEQWIERETGIVMLDMRVLDVGCGQHMRQAHYLACHNKVDAIDSDIVPVGLAPRAYLKMLRSNGLTRVLKTVLRKMSGLDRRYAKGLIKALGIDHLPPVKFQQMDAARLSFPEATFDMVFSSSVWMHLSDPAAANREVMRVLKPGGVVFHSIHLYTSDSGAHDPRVLTQDRADLPYWAHLRPGKMHLSRPSTFQNKLRLAQWCELFAGQMPGCRLEMRKYGVEQLRAELARVRAAGELAEYSDDELLTVDLWVAWRKPGGPPPAADAETTGGEAQARAPASQARKAPPARPAANLAGGGR